MLLHNRCEQSQFHVAFRGLQGASFALCRSLACTQHPPLLRAAAAADITQQLLVQVRRYGLLQQRWPCKI